MLKKIIIFFILVIQISFTQNIIERNEWKKYYDKYNIDGCFILYDLNEDKYIVYNKERIEKEFIPASTFKIPNSLIALETNVIKDENEIIKWDGIDRGWESWNKDHNLRSAIKVSAVWFYQELARRIGKEKMQYYLDKINYGNKDIRDSIDSFWLNGKLRITPMQQIEFLKKLYKNNLPFSERNLEIVKDILINEKTDVYILRAKTGWGLQTDKDIGWWVGYIETEDNVYFFVNNIEIANDGDEKSRIEISKEILRELNLLH